jgi:hypothetical protein
MCVKLQRLRCTLTCPLVECTRTAGQGHNQLLGSICHNRRSLLMQSDLGIRIDRPFERILEPAPPLVPYPGDADPAREPVH